MVSTSSHDALMSLRWAVPLLPPLMSLSTSTLEGGLSYSTQESGRGASDRNE